MKLSRNFSKIFHGNYCIFITKSTQQIPSLMPAWTRIETRDFRQKQIFASILKQFYRINCSLNKLFYSFNNTCTFFWIQLRENYKYTLKERALKEQTQYFLLPYFKHILKGIREQCLFFLWLILNRKNVNYFIK